MSYDFGRYFTKREAILYQNEMLRSDPRFREVSEALWRCPICAQPRCKDRERCREQLREWTQLQWDTAVERASYRRQNSVDEPTPTT